MTLKCKSQSKEALKPKQKWSDITGNTYNKCSPKNRKVKFTIQSKYGQTSNNNSSTFFLKTSRTGNNYRG
jgi:hypothetical protein